TGEYSGGKNINTGDPCNCIGPGWDQGTGYGRVNAKKALDFLGRPYTLTQEHTPVGGRVRDMGASPEFTMCFWGAMGLTDGSYTVKSHEVQVDITFSSININAPYVWGRGWRTI